MSRTDRCEKPTHPSKDILSRPLRSCLLVEEPKEDMNEKEEKWENAGGLIGVLCSMRLRKKCAVTGTFISDLEHCPTSEYLLK